jgi:hypothetical protein
MRRFSCPFNRIGLAVAVIAFLPCIAYAFLITGGEGNEPVRDPGWPGGAAMVFNQPTRIAYWEGPPFGGGQWTGEYRGNAGDLNIALPFFDKMDAKVKRIVVHDGVGRSLWLNPNRELTKVGIAQMDWSFMVWQPANWKKLRKMPAGLRPADMGDDKTGPPTQLDVYTGGNLHWEDVVVPKGIEVIDERLTAHGFTLKDGTVLEGTITDLETKKPIAAQVELQLVEPQKKGGYRYTALGQAAADSKGHWFTKHTPVSWQRMVVKADGYVPRVIGYFQFSGEPGWHRFDGALTRPAPVSGRVTDDAEKPLADAIVRLVDVASHGEEYTTPDDFEMKTGADGQFHFDGVPTGSARIWVRKDGYSQRELGPTIRPPAKDVVLKISRAAQVHVTVEFAGGKRPAEYIVDIEPEGGNKVGSWGGGSQIDAENKCKFENVPPGRYVLRGHPNPTTDVQITAPIKIELKGGATEEIKIQAK